MTALQTIVKVGGRRRNGNWEKITTRQISKQEPLRRLQTVRSSSDAWTPFGGVTTRMRNSSPPPLLPSSRHRRELSFPARPRNRYSRLCVPPHEHRRVLDGQQRSSGSYPVSACLARTSRSSRISSAPIPTPMSSLLTRSLSVARLGRVPSIPAKSGHKLSIPFPPAPTPVAPIRAQSAASYCSPSDRYRALRVGDC